MTSKAISRGGLAFSSHARILVVDDFGPFRDTVRSMLEVRPDLLIVAEASNGQEAIEKAGEFCPDLILLDVSLPNLNGIAAARAIQNVVPDSKIIFLGRVTDADIVAEAMRLLTIP
jgi:DNA-binding NarL/FixJ family response regulator